MASLDLNLSSDSFILERDQAAYLNNPAAQSTPKTLHNPYSAEQSPIIQDVYEIINTGREHIVLYHETAPASILSTAQEDTLPIRRFTNVNPIIPDDIFMSPPRNYDNMDSWLYSPNDGTMSPISDTSSIGYFSGSDWTTDSSWFSYDSLIQSVFQQPISSPFRPVSPLPPIPDAPHESRGLSRPQRCHGNHMTRGTPEEGSEETDQVKSESP